MTRFVLSVLDADHLILSTTESFDRAQYHAIKAQFDEWKQNGGVAIISDCAVRDPNSIEIELDSSFIASEAEIRHDHLLNQEPIAARPVVADATQGMRRGE